MTIWERRLLGTSLLSSALFLFATVGNRAALAADPRCSPTAQCHSTPHCGESRITTVPTYYIKCCQGTGTGNAIHDCAVDDYSIYSFGVGIWPPAPGLPVNPCTTFIGTCHVIHNCTISSPRVKC